MHPARIAELLEPFLQDASDQRLTTNDELCHYISTYIDILQRWNSRINLTAIRGEETIVTRHFGESLFLARHLFPSNAHVGTAALVCPSERSSALRVADLGSGAGFPGIPIKLWAPEISLTLIESSQKKATFLREVVRSLTLTKVDIQNLRGEDLSPDRAFDVVTLRAVEHFTSALPVAAALLAPAGRLALLIGSTQLSQAHSTLPSFSWDHPTPIPASQSRILLVGTVPKK